MLKCSGKTSMNVLYWIPIYSKIYTLVKCYSWRKHLQVSSPSLLQCICQQPPQVSRATWSVFCLVDLIKPRNSSSETARMKRALCQSWGITLAGMWTKIFKYPKGEHGFMGFVGVPSSYLTCYFFSSSILPDAVYHHSKPICHSDCTPYLTVLT